jgi:uncharacterized protein
MSGGVPGAYAFNRTRGAYLATELDLARTHWSRFRGLMATDPRRFRAGQGLWIVPCHGVHTLGMRFAIDALYLDDNNVVVHLEENLKPWRFAAVRSKARSVLELPHKTVSVTGTTLGDKIEIALGHAEKGQTA